MSSAQQLDVPLQARTRSHRDGDNELDRAFTWIGNHRVAIEDTGDDEPPACTRVFDLNQVTSPGRGRTRQAAEMAVLHGPEGRFSATEPPC